MRLPEFCQRVFVHLADAVLTDKHLAAGRLFQARQLVQQRGFAAAGSTDNAAELPRLNGQRNIVQSHHFFFAHAVHLAQVLHPDNGRHRTTSLT